MKQPTRWAAVAGRVAVRLACAVLTIVAAPVPAQTSAAAPAQAGNAIESVTSQRQGAETYVSIVLRQPPASAPGRFLRNAPPAVVLDFDGADNGLGKDKVEFVQGDVRDATVERASGGSRLTLNLRRPLLNTMRVEGRTVTITFSPQEDVSPAPAWMPPVAGSAGANAPHALRDLDFRRGRDGSGRVVVELSDDQAAAEVRRRGKELDVDLPQTRLPANLRRSLDVTDFGTPVVTVRTTEYPGGTRIAIQPEGAWDYTAYQSGTQLVIEVRRLQDDSARQGGRPGYHGERLSLTFQNIDVRALLEVFADFTNLNIVASDSVTGSLTLRLKDVPWDQALDIVLQARGLAMRKSGNVLMIAPRAELEAREKRERELADYEAPVAEVFQLNYQKADAMAKMLSGDKQRILSKVGSAVADPRTNKLFVRDTPSIIEQVRKLIAQFDVPVRQVLIEARIVQATDNFARNLGAKLGFNDNRSTATQTVAVTDPATGQLTNMVVPVYGPGTQVGGNTYATIAGNLQGAAELSSQLGSGASSGSLAAPGIGIRTALANTNFVNLPANSINGVAPASFAISLFGSGLTRFLNLELSALEADDKGKVVSSPRVLTADKATATIEQGTEVPFQVATSSGATSIQFRKASLRLQVTPQITPDGSVLMDVEVNNDSLGILTPQGYSIDRRAVQTKVLVENGGTVVIGGIYVQTSQNSVNKVPLLGDIPVIGNVFKNRSATNNRAEMLVFLTPRVVTDSAIAR